MDEQRRRKLEVTAADWADHGRATRGLLDPTELADAEQWRKTESAAQLGHSEEVGALITASQAALAKQRRRRRSLVGGAFAAVIAFAVIVTVLALAARSSANEAHEQTNRAVASEHEKKLC